MRASRPCLINFLSSPSRAPNAFALHSTLACVSPLQEGDRLFCRPPCLVRLPFARLPLHAQYIVQAYFLNLTALSRTPLRLPQRCVTVLRTIATRTIPYTHTRTRTELAQDADLQTSPPSELPLSSSPSALPRLSAESGTPAPPRRLKVCHSVATDEFSSGPRRPTVLQVLAACPSPRSTVMPTPRPFTDLSLGWVRSRLQAPGCSPLLERTTANGTSHVAHCTAVICIAIDDLRPTSLRSQASGPNRISHLATRNSPLTCRFPVSPSCAYTHTHTHTVKLLPDAVTPPSTSTTLLGSRLIAPRSSFFCVPVAAPALDALTGIVHRRARDPAPATRGRECGREL